MSDRPQHKVRNFPSPWAGSALGDLPGQIYAGSLEKRTQAGEMEMLQPWEPLEQEPPEQTTPTKEGPQLPGIPWIPLLNHLTVLHKGIF